MRKVCVLLGVLFVMALVFNQAQAAEPVKVGLNDAMSGPFKSSGDRFKSGLELAIKDINKSGGLLGRPVELIVEDNQMKPEIAVQKVKKMVLKDKCEAIFHASSSGVGLAIAQAMPRYKKLYVCMAAFAMGITGEQFTPYTFRTESNTVLLAKTMAQYIGKKKQFKKVYMINQDYSYGHDIANYYERFVKEIAPHTEIVGKDFHPLFNKDFGPYISKVNASGADYVLSGNWGTDLIQLIIQGRRLGMNIPVAAILMADINACAAMPGDEAVGNFGVGSYIPGLDTPEARRFEDSFYEKSGGTWPVEQILYSYKALTLYAKAVREAGSLDIQKVIKAFEAIKWNGPTGTVAMRAKDHQIQMPMCVGQIVKKTKYFDYPYLKPLQVIPLEQLRYNPEEFGWRPYEGK
jgi:branched-chain amino acid transport system substrate-binding protein